MKDLASLHLDDHDSRLKYYHLFMTTLAEAEIPHYDLRPQGIRSQPTPAATAIRGLRLKNRRKEFSTF